ncbi:MAG: hypothetical protein ISS63_02935 [Desulfobacteraceae bacterium]|nr:hypothetical protein [Desulfobacteraceae bacterium]
MEKSIDEKMNDTMEMSAENLLYTLPSFFDQILKNGVAKSMAQSPGLLYRLLTKFEESDLSKIGADAPEIFDTFMDIFWDGISAKSEDVRSDLEEYENFAVNYETNDTPLKAHFRVSGGKITGGSGMVKYREQDVRWFGDTKEIFLLLKGEFDMVKLYTETLFFEGFIGTVINKSIRLNRLVGSLAM